MLSLIHILASTVFLTPAKADSNSEPALTASPPMTTAEAMAAAAAAAGVIGGLAVKAGSDFESAFAGVRKTVDATEEQFAQLEAGLRDMAKNKPQTAVELAEIAEAAGQLGIHEMCIRDRAMSSIWP